MKFKDALFACALSAAIAIVPLAGCVSQASSAPSTASSTGSWNASAAASATSAAAAEGDEQFVIFLGTTDKDTNQPTFSREDSKERAKAILMENFTGYTIQEAEGGWKGDDGREYQDYTLVIYLSETNIDTVHAAAQKLMDEFHQASVLINTQRVHTEFYTGA